MGLQQVPLANFEDRSFHSIGRLRSDQLDLKRYRSVHLRASAFKCGGR